MSDKPTPREYIRDTVIPALKLAGYSIIEPEHYYTYHVEIEHAGYKELIQVREGEMGYYKECVEIVATSVWRAKPSKFVTDRATGTANLAGILATVKRLAKEARTRCEAAAAEKVRTDARGRLYAANLPVLEALAYDLGKTVDTEHDTYSDFPARVDLGGIILRPSQRKADCVSVTLYAAAREGNTYTVTPAEARTFIDAFRALEAAHARRIGA